MSKIDVVRATMVEAMKAKDKQRKDALSMLLSALKNSKSIKGSRADYRGRGKYSSEERDQAVSGDLMTPRLRTGMTSARRRLTVCQFIRNLRLRI